MSLVQIFLAFFMAAPSDTRITNDEGQRPPRNKPRNAVCSALLGEAMARLETAADLLVTPTPQAIQEVSLVLEEAYMWVRREPPSDDRQTLTADLNEVQNALTRVRHLLQGALQVQRIQMRRMIAITQIYMPGGKIAPWRPSISNVDINA